MWFQKKMEGIFFDHLEFEFQPKRQNRRHFWIKTIRDVVVEQVLAELNICGGLRFKAHACDFNEEVDARKNPRVVW